MPMTADQITDIIKSAFPDAAVELRDLAGDNDHWSATITTAAFAGKTRVAQHQMVYAAFGAHMGTTLHALQLITKAA